MNKLPFVVTNTVDEYLLQRDCCEHFTFTYLISPVVGGHNFIDKINAQRSIIILLNYTANKKETWDLDSEKSSSVA